MLAWMLTPHCYVTSRPTRTRLIDWKHLLSRHQKYVVYKNEPEQAGSHRKRLSKNVAASTLASCELKVCV